MTEIYVRYQQEARKSDLFELLQGIDLVLSNGYSLHVPSGFVTDFASVPPILWGVFPAIGKHCLAAVVHDYMYENRVFDAEMGSYQARLLADREFRRLADLAGPQHRFRHWCMYQTVRWFGAGHWQKGK